MAHPNTSPFIPLASQVGGHAGVLSSSSGDTVIKPCLPLERDFYTALSSTPAYAPLARFVPKFFGTLRLEGKLREGKEGLEAGEAEKIVLGEGTGVVDTKALEEVDAPREALVIENLTHGFVHPNVLDIKLGTQLWDIDASEEKRARMEKTARDTTSGTTGVRLTGFQVWDPSGTYTVMPKSYGKSIPPSALPEGIRKFFLPPPLSPFPTRTLLALLRSIRARVSDLASALEKVELRMRGGSVLVVYEGDPEALAQGELEDAWDVRLIDFAHTRLTPGEGPDAGVLLGLRTTGELLDGLIGELEGLEEGEKKEVVA